MRYPPGATRTPSVSGADSVALQQHEQGAGAACAHADQLIRDYFTRGLHEDPADHEALREDTLSRLFDDVEAALVQVAIARALTLNEIARKRALQDLMRAHLNVLSHHPAVVGRSIDRDLRRLLASEERSQGPVRAGGSAGHVRPGRGRVPPRLLRPSRSV